MEQQKKDTFSAWFQKLYWWGSNQKHSQLPRRFQGLLWSRPIGKLDLQKDRVYIVHQILAFGSLEDVRILFQLYSKEEVRDIFTNYPKQVYRAFVFSFVKNFILDLRYNSLNSQKYVRTAMGDN